MWFPTISINCRPPSQVRVYCPECFPPQWTRSRCVLWFTEDLWYHLEIWHITPASWLGYLGATWLILFQIFWEIVIFVSVLVIVFSERYLQESGVPQGSVLSVTLFAIAVNSVMTCIRLPVEGLLYVDDLTIVCKSANLNLASRQIQLTFNHLVDWSHQTGFRFSPTKTVCVHFCRKRIRICFLGTYNSSSSMRYDTLV